MDDKDRTTFLNRLADVASAQMWDVHAYCLLDTHAHLVLRTRHGNLGSGMGRILGWYAHRFNGRHGHEGHLFLSPFWSRVIEGPEQHVRACLYVALNPVAAGVCRTPAEFAWQRIADTAFAEHGVDVPTRRASFETTAAAIAERIVNGRELDWRRGVRERAEFLASP